MATDNGHAAVKLWERHAHALYAGRSPVVTNGYFPIPRRAIADWRARRQAD